MIPPRFKSGHDNSRAARPLRFAERAAVSRDGKGQNGRQYLEKSSFEAADAQTRAANKTIQVGLRRFIQENSSNYHLIMAASVVSLIPVSIVFLALQKYFIEGIATSGLKG